MFPTTQLITPPTTPISPIGSQGPTQLAEFASSMVYLMWHARKNTTTTTSKKSWSPSLMNNNNSNDLAYLMWQSRTKKPMNYASNTTTGDYHPFSSSSFSTSSYTASPAFKKFCFQVLTATQLQESAVYLSLKYIAILLQSNPSIEGAEGSEYRLFIVALMLANKFLDDNTFTNKTWSDVSGMKVHDLNIMEAEFLEALDYNLFVREHEYGIWKQLLEECRDRAQLSYYDSPQQRQQLVLMTLQTLGLYHSNNTTTATSNSIFDDWNYNNNPAAAARLQLENSHKRYQHFLQQQQQKMVVNQLPYVMQPPVGYGYSNNNNNACNGYNMNDSYYNNYPITNLSQSSWDPLAYSLNRSCQDYSSYYSNTNSFHAATARPISWRNYN